MLNVLGILRACLWKGHSLKKKQPGSGLGPSAGRQGYGNSSVSWQNFQDENRKIEQAREAHCLLDKPVS